MPKQRRHSIGAAPVRQVLCAAAGAATVIGIEHRKAAGGRDLTRRRVAGQPAIAVMTLGSAVYHEDQWIALTFLVAQGVHEDAFELEFADEWWKNYDNPTRAGDWWTRGPAPDDELRHDRDPEETYGLVRSDRTPKPALEVVSAMFAEGGGRQTARTVGTVALSGIVFMAAARRHHRTSRHVRPSVTHRSA
jgi:hypothetical protein